MNLIGVGSYGAAIVGELWRCEHRRHYLTRHGIREWILNEPSEESLNRSRIVQDILNSCSGVKLRLGENGFQSNEPSHLVFSLGGTGALQVVQALGEGRLNNVSIHGLIPFQFDSGHQQAVRIAVALKLWQMADSERSVTLISANDLVAPRVNMATALQQIQESLMDSVCAGVECTAGYFRA